MVLWVVHPGELGSLVGSPWAKVGKKKKKSLIKRSPWKKNDCDYDLSQDWVTGDSHWSQACKWIKWLLWWPSHQTDPWQKSYGVWCGSNSGQRMSSWNMEGAAASSLGWKIGSRYSWSRHSVCWVWVSVLKKRVSLLFQDWRHDSVTVPVCWGEERAEYTNEAGGDHAGDVVSSDKHGNILLLL